jgi:hypothetical protein
VSDLQLLLPQQRLLRLSTVTTKEVVS